MKTSRLLSLALALSLGSITLPPAPQASAGAAMDAGATVEDFTLPQLKGGKDFTLSQHKGKVVLLSFWASWCGPCRRELPAYNHTYAKYKDKGLEIVAISVDRNAEEAMGFINQLEGGLSYTLLLDSKSMVMGRFDIVSMPTSFLIGPDGKVINREVGFSDEKLAEVEAMIEKALASK